MAPSEHSLIKGLKPVELAVKSVVQCREHFAQRRQCADWTEVFQFCRIIFIADGFYHNFVHEFRSMLSCWLISLNMLPIISFVSSSFLDSFVIASLSLLVANQSRLQFLFSESKSMVNFVFMSLIPVHFTSLHFNSLHFVSARFVRKTVTDVQCMNQMSIMRSTRPVWKLCAIHNSPP